MSEKNPDTVAFTEAKLRPRLLSDEHFEFRDVEAQHVPRCREARLRSEYSHLYPWLTPGIWRPAAVVVEKVVSSRHRQRLGIMDRDELSNCGRVHLQLPFGRWKKLD